MKIIITVLSSLIAFVVSAQADLSQPFKECNVDGSITLYHLQSDSWIFSDLTDAKKETLPASTFKILNSAIALEAGVVNNEHEVWKWDGTEKSFFGTPIDAWNRDIDMETAFRTSAIWFYEEMAKYIGRESYRRWVELVDYGNGDLLKTDGDFWNFGNFGISLFNQITFLKAFYLEELPISSATYQIVKQMMVTESTDTYTLSGKTGWTKTASQDIGWWVGYVEKNNDTWFFATRITKNLSDDNPEFSTCRISITKAVLNQAGAFDEL